MDNKKALNLISKICNPGDKDIMKLGIGVEVEEKIARYEGMEVFSDKI